jgi:hypothetical protein
VIGENLLYKVKAALTGPHAPPSRRTPPPPAGAPGGQRANNAGRLARTSRWAARRQYISNHRAEGLSWNSRQALAAHGDASGGGTPAPGWSSNLWSGWGEFPSRPPSTQASPAARLRRRKPGCDRWRPMIVEGSQAKGHVKPDLHLCRRPAAASRWVDGRRDGTVQRCRLPPQQPVPVRLEISEGLRSRRSGLVERTWRESGAPLHDQMARQ